MQWKNTRLFRKKGSQEKWISKLNEKTHYIFLLRLILNGHTWKMLWFGDVNRVLLEKMQNSDYIDSNGNFFQIMHKSILYVKTYWLMITVRLLNFSTDKRSVHRTLGQKLALHSLSFFNELWKCTYFLEWRVRESGLWVAIHFLDYFFFVSHCQLFYNWLLAKSKPFELGSLKGI